MSWSLSVTRALALTCLVWLAAAGSAEAQLGALLSPGRLSQAHAELEGITKCRSCHEPGRRVTVEKCLACHSPVAERITRKVGVHRNVKGDCVACHSEHAGVNGELRPFDARRFDHNAETTFRLDDRHAPVAQKCESCHKGRSFLTASPSCASCHTDPHKPSLGQACQSCHSAKTAFKVISGQFDHAKSKFPLVGAHRTATCSSCHVNNQFKGIAFSSCTSCHKEPHRPSLGATCTSCHTSDNWRTQKIDHTKTAFRLLGRHVTTNCAACHKQPAMKVKPRADTCAVCHVDVHKGSFKQDCKSCHNETSFTKAPFDHTQTKFALTGKHAPLECRACHKSVVLTGRPVAKTSADFRGLATTCVSCHADVHKAELGQACESCHNSTSFRLASYTHTRFPEFFGGQHAPVACAKCHLPTAPASPVRTAQPLPVALAAFKSVATTCASCHKDVHLGQESQECQTCHTVQAPKFELENFAHSKTTFALSGRHQTTACALCHKTETGTFPSGHGTAMRLKGVGRECAACHKDVHLGQLSARCESCHGTTTFKLADYRHVSRPVAGFFAGSHVRATCDACHKPVTAKFPQGTGTAVLFSVGARCVACHTDVHRGALGANCITCHRP